MSSRPERAALVTGGSSGIGLAIARVLAEDGHGVTLSARRPDKLEAATRGLAGEGLDVQAVPANAAEEEDLVALVDRHRERYGRLDVLVNNAGVGAGGALEQTDTKRLDLQLAVNLRAAVLTLREGGRMLRAAGAEHGKALVVNVASIAGIHGEAGLAVYSATKAGLIALSQAAHGELGPAGVQVTALCPGFVDTAMSEWTDIPREEMIRPRDIAEAVRFLLRTSPACVVPEIRFIRPGARV